MIGPVVGHVGTKVSALVDGQLPPDVADRLWAHVHCCPLCRDQVEREGWVKTRVAELSTRRRPTPDYLTSLLSLDPADLAVADEHPQREHAATRRRTAVAAVVGAGSVGAAVLGVLAVAGPAATPPMDRRAPVADFSNPSQPAGPVQPISSTAPSAVDNTLLPAAALAAKFFLGQTLSNGWVTISK